MINTMKSIALGNSVPVRTTGDPSWYGTLWILVACLGVLATFFFAGCSGSQAHAVHPSVARDTLKSALDHWKNGDDPKSLGSSATPLTAQDFDWAGGAK